MRIPSELIPRCPRCGEEMTTNLRVDNRFVQDEGWEATAGRYQDFLERTSSGRVLHLELGVGMNTPSIIKFPFWRRVYDNPEATYACVALGRGSSRRDHGSFTHHSQRHRRGPGERARIPGLAPYPLSALSLRIFRIVEAMMESKKMLKRIAPTLGDTSVATRRPAGAVVSGGRPRR